MGLSRKLGGGAAASSSRPETPVCVDYKWSTQAYSLRDILARFQLPCVVQCAADPGSVVWADFQFDLRQPLLLHGARTVRKIHARSLKIEGQTDQLQEFGPTLAIPEDYDGWFYPVTKNDPTALPRHTRIESAATSPARQFLVATTLPAFVPSMVPATGPKYSTHEVTVGEVLTKVDVVTDDLSLEVAMPSTTPEPLPAFRQSLRCLDENQHEVIVPFHHLALLHDVAENYNHAVKAAQRSIGGIAVEMSGMEAEAEADAEGGATTCVPGVVSTRTIVTSGNACLPRVFRHVLGEEPALEGTFSGLLRCYSVFTEETVMAATMSSWDLSSMFELPSCLELSANSSAKFRIGLNASDLKRTNQYVAALRTCEELAYSYVRAIKASFTVHPVTSEQRDVDLSFNENENSVVDGPGIGAWAKEVGENNTSGKAKGEERERASATSGGARRPGEMMRYGSGADDEVEDSSISEAPDDSGDVTSMSDAPEVEASSEFHISWGELKRARSYSGSLSDASDNDAEDSDTQVSSATESDTEMSSSTDRDAQISSATESDCNSVVINDYNSSTWKHSVLSSSSNFRNGSRIAENQSSDYTSVSCHSSHATQDVDVDLCPVDREGPTARPHQVSVVRRLGVPDASNSTEDRCTQDAGGGRHTSESIPGHPQKILIADRTGAVTKSMAHAIIPGNHTFHNMEISSADSASFNRSNNDSRQLGMRVEVRETSGHVIKKEQASHELEHSTRQRAGSVPMAQTVTEKGCNISSSGHLAPYSHPSSVPSGLDRLTTQWPPKKRTQSMGNGDGDRVQDKNASQSQEKADDFVKTLGDKLLLVSRRSSSPRYQRLETYNNDDVPDNTSSKTNDSRTFAQKQYGRSLSSITYDRSVRSANDLLQFGDTVVMVQDTSFSTDSEEDSGGEMAQKSIFDEFDLLHEEIV